MKRIISIILILVMLAGIAALGTSAASVTITDTVNIAAARQNMHGHGYDWANRTSTLTLTGVDIDTKNDYGLRLPAECTVVLAGNNYIKAEKYGISCAGNVIFKGKGTLTVDAGEYGIYLISQDNTTKVRVLSGSYSVTAGVYGIYSEYTDFSLAGGRLDIKTNGGSAIMGRAVNLVGGSVKADSPIECTHSLLIDSVNLDIDAALAALSAKNLSLRHLDVTEYNGENSIHARAVKRWHSKSAVFGEDVPGWVDFVVFAAFLLIIAACITLPVLRRKKKAKKLYERLRAEGYDTFGN